MPGTWPGTTITEAANTVQAIRKASTPKVLSPLNVSAKEFNTNEGGKSGSVSSLSENARKSNHSKENIDKISDNICCNRNSSLTPSAAAKAKRRISARGSITSVGAILAGAT